MKFSKQNVGKGLTMAGIGHHTLHQSSELFAYVILIPCLIVEVISSKLYHPRRCKATQGKSGRTALAFS